jgi:type IV pilus assembly protein PilY1
MTMTRKPFRRSRVALAVLAALAGGMCGRAAASPLSISQVPLFVSTAQKANVLLILDNSNSMDEAPNGSAVGSASPDSKSEIARGAAKTIVSNYQGKINLGLMAYQQYTSGADPVSLYQLHNSQYDVSYNPANYNPAYNGPRKSLTKRFRTPNPTSPGDYIYYNVALPYYSTTNDGNGFCYSQTADFDNGSETYPGGPWDNYRCYTIKTGTSDALPAYDGTGAAAAGYSGGTFTLPVSPTDSDLAQGILDFGRFISWSYVSPTWFSNSNPGRGFLHVPIGNLDAAKAAALNNKLATSQFTSNKPTDPAYPLQNAGLTPIEGTLLTARDYFLGNLTAAAQGGPQSAPPPSCGKDFAVLLTDGLPSTRANGTAISVPATALSEAAAAAATLNSDPRKVKTYVVGFALPYGTDPHSLDVIANAGGTTTAFNASDTATLNSTFSTIFDDILAQSGSAAAVALTSGTVIAGGKIYQGQFNSADWSGDLIAYNTDPATGDPASVAWHAGSILNGQNWDTGRTIVTYKPSNSKGIPFRWPSNPSSPGASELDVAQSTALQTDISNVNDGRGQERLEFLRGRTGIAGFRVRSQSVLGDLVNSAPAYAAAPAFNYPDDLESAPYSSYRVAYRNRTPMVYVGGNDGMLHGFDATSGQERLAFVPGAVYSNLSKLTAPTYTHRYFVDGSPTIVDTFYAGAWHTTLVGTLGAGGQSVFALDVTDPASFTEAHAASIVRWEFSDPDLGYAIGQPSIVKLNNGKWAAVFSSGYNNTEADGSASKTGYAYLFIVDIETGSLIKKISTGEGSTSTPNGLAQPSLVDTDGNGTADVAYAGDLLGNVWKFDLGASNPSQWGVAFNANAPLFVAKDASNQRQPITGGIEVTRHPTGDGFLIYVGTGKYLESSDLAPGGTQTVYALWDKALSPSTIAGRGQLLEQEVVSTTTYSGKNYRRSSSNTIDWATQRGWYMDLTSGERIVSQPALFGGRLLFTTIIPTSDGACGNGGTGWLMEVDALSGGKLNGPTFDVNGDGKIDSDDNLGSEGDYGSGQQTASIPSAIRLQKNPGGAGNGTLNKLISQSKVDLSAAVSGSLVNVKNSLPSSQKRTSWRQILE